MIKVRAYQQAVGPNVIELFTPQGLGLFNMASDPCGGATPAFSLAQCQNTGVTAAQYRNILSSPAGQYNQLFGGNPALTPEKAKTQTIGVVVQPMRNLSATLDYFNIKVDTPRAAWTPTPSSLRTWDAVQPDPPRQPAALWPCRRFHQGTNVNLAVKTWLRHR